MHLALHLLRLGASDRRGHGDRLARVRGGLLGLKTGLGLGLELEIGSGSGSGLVRVLGELGLGLEIG